jgi:hypothetical protein
MGSYVYVVARKDLSAAQQAVQSGHAVLEMSRVYPGSFHEHPSLVYLAVKNEDELKRVIQKLVLHGKIQFQTFQEPDIGNQYTALATVPITGSDRAYFKSFKLNDFQGPKKG